MNSPPLHNHSSFPVTRAEILDDQSKPGLTLCQARQKYITYTGTTISTKHRPCLRTLNPLPVTKKCSVKSSRLLLIDVNKQTGTQQLATRADVFSCSSTRRSPPITHGPITQVKRGIAYVERGVWY